MKKILSLISIALLLLPVQAQVSFDNIKPTDLNTEIGTLKGKVGAILNFSRWAGFAICAIMLIFCAVKLSSSAGNPQKRQMAMDGLKNVFVGIAIIGGLTVLSTIAYGLIGG